MIPSRILAVEVLESRIAPAGLIAVDYDAATGELTLTGDALANEATLFETGPNTYRIESTTTEIGTAGTTFLDIGKLTKLTIDAGDGADDFDLINLRTLTAVTFSGGIGNDSLQAQNLSVKGSVEIDGGGGGLDSATFSGISTTITGNLTLDSGVGGGNNVEIGAATTVIGGSVFYRGGGSPGVLAFEGAGKVTIGKGVSFDAGSAVGTLRLRNLGLMTIGQLSSGESIFFNGGGGPDSLQLNGGDATLAGGIRMLGGARNDSLLMLAESSTIKIGKLSSGASIFLEGGLDGASITSHAASLTMAGGIEVVGSAGSNSINLTSLAGTVKIGKLNTGQSIKFSGADDRDEVFFAVGNLTLSGGIELNGDEGKNSIEISNATGSARIGKLKTGQSIVFSGGAGADTIETTLSRVTLAGGIEFNGGGGENAVDMDNVGVVQIGKFGSGQSLKLIGTANAETRVEFGGFVTFAGSIETIGGSAGTDVDLDGKAMVGKNAAGGSVQLTGGDGADRINLAGQVALAGSLGFDGGNGADHLDLSGLSSLSIKGGLEFIGAAGADSFDLRADSLLISGAVSFDGGADSDFASIVADGSIGGDVTLNLGTFTAGPQFTTLTALTLRPAGLILKGALIVDSRNTSSAVDQLTLTNLSVAKVVDLKMGEGVSVAKIDNLLTSGEFKLDTGGGSDVVEIERANFFGNSLVKKLATIQLGLGDDTLAIGRPLPAPTPPFPDGTRVNFVFGLEADGGGGANDNLNDIASENDGVSTSDLINFELAAVV